MVFTKPVPKNSAQYRFTVTRAVSGCSGETSHTARSSRLSGTGFSGDCFAGAELVGTVTEATWDPSHGLSEFVPLGVPPSGGWGVEPPEGGTPNLSTDFSNTLSD